MPTFNVQIIGSKKLLNNLNQEGKTYRSKLDKGIKKAALIISEAVKEETPVKSGTLKKGIYPDFSPLKAVIQPHNAPYAIFVHSGTSPHTIRARNKKALYWKGAKHPVRSVKHPGTKANPFMDRGFQKSIKKVEKIFTDINNTVVRNIAK